MHFLTLPCPSDEHLQLSLQISSLPRYCEVTPLLQASSWCGGSSGDRRPIHFEFTLLRRRIEAVMGQHLNHGLCEPPESHGNKIKGMEHS